MMQSEFMLLPTATENKNCFKLKRTGTITVINELITTGYLLYLCERALNESFVWLGYVMSIFFTTVLKSKNIETASVIPFKCVMCIERSFKCLGSKKKPSTKKIDLLLMMVFNSNLPTVADSLLLELNIFFAYMVFIYMTFNLKYLKIYI